MGRSLRKAIVLLGVLGFILPILGCTDWQKESQGLQVENENIKGRLARSEELRGEVEQQNRRLREELLRVQREKRELESMPREPGSLVEWEVNEGDMTIRATLPNSILFSSGSATLKTGVIKELDEVYATLLSRYSDKDISVIGHTDTDKITKSGWKDNWQLSTERSLSVVRALVQKGWPRSKIIAAGAGENRPVKGNTTVTEKAQNRRVEIVVHML